MLQMIRIMGDTYAFFILFLSIVVWKIMRKVNIRKYSIWFPMKIILYISKNVPLEILIDEKYIMMRNKFSCFRMKQKCREI